MKEQKQSALKLEAAIYRIVNGEIGFPKLYWYGSEGDYNVMVIELLGRSIESLIQICGRKFSLATTFVLAEQMVSLLLNNSYQELKHFIQKNCCIEI